MTFTRAYLDAASPAQKCHLANELLKRLREDQWQKYTLGNHSSDFVVLGAGEQFNRKEDAYYFMAFVTRPPSHHLEPCAVYIDEVNYETACYELAAMSLEREWDALVYSTQQTVPDVLMPAALTILYQTEIIPVVRPKRLRVKPGRYEALTQQQAREMQAALDELKALMNPSIHGG